MTATPAWLAAVESLLNRSIVRSQQASAAAGRLNGCSLHIDVDGLARIRAAVSGGRLALTAGGPQADAVLSGSALSLLDMLARGTNDPGGARSRQRVPVRISGDAEVVKAYGDLFALARPDWEEELSQLVGDLPARRLSLLARDVLSFARKFRRTAGDNIAEYLKEESRVLVNEPELEEFLSGVDQLRETADRVESRLLRVEHRLKGRA